MWTYETTRSASTVTTSSQSMSSVESESENFNASTSFTTRVIGPTSTVTTSILGTAFDNSTSSSSQSVAFLSLIQETSYIDPTNSTNTLFAAPPATALSTVFWMSAESINGSQSTGSTNNCSSNGSTQRSTVSNNSWTLVVFNGTYGFGSSVEILLSSESFSSSFSSSSISTAGTTTSSHSSSGTRTGSTFVSQVNSSTQNSTGFTEGQSFTSIAGTRTTTSTQSFSFPNNGTIAYSYTTSTRTTSVGFTATTTVTREFDFPGTTTVSVSSTTTTAGTPSTTSTTASANSTASSSSAETVTTSSATTTSTSQTFTPTTSIVLSVCFDTVAIAESTDWAWSVTTTGSDSLGSIGASFTRTTFSATNSGGSAPCATPTLDNSVVVQTVTYSSTTYDTSSITSTVRTTTASTYNVATAGVGGLASFPITAAPLTASVTYTTSTSTAYTFFTSATVTEELLVDSFAGNTFVASFTDTVTTTFSGGTSLSMLSYTLPEPANAIEARTGSETGSIGVPSQGTFTQVDNMGVTVASASVTLKFPHAMMTSGATPKFLDTTVGPGWQVPSSMGAGAPIGTNVSASAAAEVALGWPAVSVPVLNSTDTANVAGAVPSTFVNLQETSRMGGFSWNTSASTVITLTGSQTSSSTDSLGNPTTVTVDAPAKIWRATTADSFSNTATTEYSTSVISIGPGQGIAFESVPEVASQSSQDSPAPFLNFPAFPST